MSIRAQRFPRAVLAASAALFVFACGGDRPESTEASSATMFPPALKTNSDDPDAALPSSVVVGPCTPGAWVPCHMWYRDLFGKLQCPMSTALCRPDGLATYECGAWRMTPEGPQPLDAGADADLLDE